MRAPHWHRLIHQGRHTRRVRPLDLATITRRGRHHPPALATIIRRGHRQALATIRRRPSWAITIRRVRRQALATIIRQVAGINGTRAIIIAATASW